VLLKDAERWRALARAATAIVGTVGRSLYTYSAIYLASVFVSFGQEEWNPSSHPVSGVDLRDESNRSRVWPRLGWTPSQRLRLSGTARIVTVLEGREQSKSNSQAVCRGEHGAIECIFPDLKTSGTVVDLSGDEGTTKVPSSCSTTLREGGP